MAFTIREGMTCVTSDGEKLGKVIGREGDALVVEKGFFFPKDYLCRMSDVRDVRNDEVILALTRSELERSFEDRKYTGDERAPHATAGGLGESSTTGISSSARQDVRVPLKEEELDVQKRSRQTGAVKVTKEVITEEKHLKVPVTREEVHVERVPASGARATAGDTRFEKDTVNVPVMEEEVTVTKRPVVKEEVRISKTAHTEQKDVSGRVRREEAKIDRDHDTVESDEDRLDRERRLGVQSPYQNDPHTHQ